MQDADLDGAGAGINNESSQSGAFDRRQHRIRPPVSSPDDPIRPRMSAGVTPRRCIKAWLNATTWGNSWAAFSSGGRLRIDIRTELLVNSLQPLLVLGSLQQPLGGCRLRPAIDPPHRRFEIARIQQVFMLLPGKEMLSRTIGNRSR